MSSEKLASMADKRQRKNLVSETQILQTTFLQKLEDDLRQLFLCNAAREPSELPVLAPMQTSSTLFLSSRIRQMPFTEESAEANEKIKKEANRHLKSNFIEIDKHKNVKAVHNFG